MTQSLPAAPASPVASRFRPGISALREVPRAEIAAFIGVVGFAFLLNAWSISNNGYGNTYYAAAARSMSESWSNFFFGSFDPGGFITVDKPPVFLWVDAAVVRVFGYSSWTLLIPSAFAGAATVALLWLLVRRYFGPYAASAAAIVLALTPISVAVNRINLPEPILILSLVGAAFATLRSLDARRWWAWTIAAGVLVGVAFNTKMLAGWIPGPSFALAIIAAHWRGYRPAVVRIAAQLAILAVSTFVFSASWMLIVDNWPGSRPYIGGSTDNTVQNLALEYNGVGRVDGEGKGPGGGQFNRNGGANPGANGANPVNGNIPGNGTLPANRGGGTIPDGGQGTRPQNGNGGFPGGQGQAPGGFNTVPGAGGGTGNVPGGGAPQNVPNGGAPGASPANGRGAGGIIAGVPGPWRMLDDANGPQIAWFLPFALGGGLLALWFYRRDGPRRAAVFLGLGWVLTFGVVFSYAQGIYHSYYTAALAPGIALLVGASLAAAIGLAKTSRWWLLPFAALAIGTGYLQLDLADRFDGFYEWVHPAMLVAVGAGLVALALTILRPSRVPSAAGLSIVLAGLLFLPAAWSWNEVRSEVTNTTLPQAGPRAGGASGQSFGSQPFDSGTQSLAAFLQAHSDPGATWDLAVSSAQNASTLIAEYDLSVMAIGGFSGSDPTITASEFATMVKDGEVRYVLVGGGRGGAGGPAGANINGRPQGGGAVQGTAPATNSASSEARGSTAVMTAVQASCTAVTSADVPASYRGSLYDCAGATW